MAVLITIPMFTNAQNYFSKFRQMHFPEKVWIVCHPFAAIKAAKITEKVKEIAEEKIKDPDFDGDYSGGQVDAFRHTLWMALLCTKISCRKAEKLGKAHEKANRIDFKKKILEEEILPDSVSCQMDLYNNSIGLEIGKKHKNRTQEEIIYIVKQAVLEGKCVIIKKDKNGNFLDKDGNIIPDEKWKGKWNTPKVLVPSNYKRP